MIPKHHGEKLTDIPDAYLSEMLPIARRIAVANGVDNYNLLQNNGALAHQARTPRAAPAAGDMPTRPALTHTRVHVGARAHTRRRRAQAVAHVHLHVIPKTTDEDGLGIEWPMQPTDHGKLKALAERLRGRM